MSIQPKDKIILAKILDEVALIEEIATPINLELFCENKIVQHATVMALLNAGELARLLETETRQQSTEIPWKQIVGLRNVAAHGYSSLSMADIWKTISHDVPELKRNIEKLLNTDK